MRGAVIGNDERFDSYRCRAAVPSRDALAADLERNRSGPYPTVRISLHLAHRALTESAS